MLCCINVRINRLKPPLNAPSAMPDSAQPTNQNRYYCKSVIYPNLMIPKFCKISIQIFMTGVLSLLGPSGCGGKLPPSVWLAVWAANAGSLQLKGWYCRFTCGKTSDCGVSAVCPVSHMNIIRQYRLWTKTWACLNRNRPAGAYGWQWCNDHTSIAVRKICRGVSSSVSPSPLLVNRPKCC